MRAHRIVSGAPIDQLTGLILCHDVIAGGVRLKKGHVIQPGNIAALRGADWSELHVIEIEAGDVVEAEAVRRLAIASAGDGVTPGEPTAIHWPLVATRRGMLDVSVDALLEANLCDGICIYTLFNRQIVNVGEHIARVKVAPMVLEERLVGDVERIAMGRSGLVCVRPFQPRRIGVVAAETLGTEAAIRLRAALAEKVSWFGSTLRDPVFVPSVGEALGDAMRDEIASGAELLLVAGTKSMDPLDGSWNALRQVGATVECFGVPAHPGSLFWIAWLGEIAILGVPTCGLFSQASVVDLILPRVLTGERIGKVELAELGHGGFLTRDYAFRFPPYRGGTHARGEVEDD